MSSEYLKEIVEGQLFHAATTNDFKLLNYLVDQKLNVNHLFFGAGDVKSFWAPLHLCCQYGSYECCQILLQSGADVNIADRYGQTPVMYAVTSGWSKLIELMLTYHCDTHIKDISGHTVAHLAAMCEDEKIMEVLLRHDIDINIKDTLGRTPLWLAASNDVSINVLSITMDGTCDKMINARDSMKKRNALQAAIMTTSTDLYRKVEILVHRGCNIYNIDHRMFTPMMNLVQRWYESLMKKRLTGTLKKDLIQSMRLLVASGYTINFHTAGTRDFDHDGSVIHLVAKLGLYEVVDILVEEGVHVNQRNNKGLTALHIAAHYKQIEVLKKLLENGSNMCDSAYFTFHHFRQKIIFGSAFRLALESGAPKAALFLNDAGYDLHLETYLLDEIDVPDILKKNKKLLEYFKCDRIKRQNHVPDCLYILCIKMLRYMFASRMEKCVSRLPLPIYIRNSVCLDSMFD